MVLLCASASGSQAIAAAESYIQQHKLQDVEIEVETSNLDEVQQVSTYDYIFMCTCEGWVVYFTFFSLRGMDTYRVTTTAHQVC